MAKRSTMAWERSNDWLCLLDQAKCIIIATLLNRKAALMFTTSIAEHERKRTVSMLGRSFFSFIMDGSTDISGDEQEAIYIRFSQSRDNWKVSGNTPNSTCSKDLEEFVLKMFESNKIDKGHWLDFDIWCLMPLSAIFQLYHGDQF
jgi:hypothetical protein